MWYDFRKLEVWKRSMQLVDIVYQLTQKFPTIEQFWLTSQVRRCAVSIPSNIAEWNDRNSQKDFSRFLYISKWSCSELETQLLIACRQWYISKDELDNTLELLVEVRKMLSWLISKL